MKRYNLKEACEMLADLYEALPETWINDGEVAHDESGHPCDEDADVAVAWCAGGGISTMCGFWPSAELDPIAEKLGFGWFADCSNSSRENAIKMLRLAAARAEVTSEAEAI